MLKAGGDARVNALRRMMMSQPAGGEQDEGLHPAYPLRPVLWAAILASFVAFLDGAIVNVALPAMSDEFGGGLALQQWVVDAYLLTLGALILLAGSLSDGFGRVRILRLGLLLFGAASLACALASSGAVLVAARAVQGVGGALLVPSSLALIMSAYSGPAQGRAIGTWTGWTGTSAIAGPLLGGVLVDMFSWRWIFGINVLPIAATLVLLSRLKDPPPARRRPPVDLAGAVLAAAGLAGTVFGLIEQQRLGWTHPAVLGCLVLGLACLVAFLWWEGRTPYPMMPLELFRSRNFGIGNIATAFIYAALSLGMLMVVLFLQQVAGFSATQAGLATLPVAVLMLLFSASFGGLAGKFGPRVFMAAGPVLLGAGYLLMLAARTPVDFWLQLLPGLVVCGLGLAITVAPLTAGILSAVRPEESGIGSAINNAVSRVAGLIAVAFAAVVTGGTLDDGGFHRVLLVVALLAVAGGLISAWGIRNVPAPAGPPVETPGRAAPETIASEHASGEERAGGAAQDGREEPAGGESGPSVRGAARWNGNRRQQY
ncbi:arabinose efflux permease family protein [Arthrobacter crystallopoietes BAB-32]|uniref:Arabinose efflux permease family protein n=1 Tax=Arthrobacter crystallopoietes BAB-32 TaxID=1246476 RepID=N1V9T3_9MICC|nr:MFS transporter [Arthrobacter crystallopoietes]EMY35048.1 arabinose efflux permease family protein [Arthrobacter crystallopoietes BAB-32]